MKEVYQTIIDKVHGNCMQAAIASLFDDELDNVPNFIEFDDNWFVEMEKYVESKGYKYDGMLFNNKWNDLIHHDSYVFDDGPSYCEELLLSALKDEVGVNGLFYAGVCSPALFSWDSQSFHAVLVDKDCNIVFDPNPNYKDKVRKYPFADFIGYNGVIDVYLFNKK